jgi:hypothetical protein
MSRTISIDRLSPETITALSIDLGFVPEAVVAPKAAPAPVDPEQVEYLAQFEGQRIRVAIAGRKMSVPGRYEGGKLHTNWGLELDLSTEKVIEVQVRNPDTGRFVAPVTDEPEEEQDESHTEDEQEAVAA